MEQQQHQLSVQDNIMVGQAVNLATEFVLARAKVAEEMVMGAVFEAKIINATGMFIRILTQAKADYQKQLNEATQQPPTQPQPANAQAVATAAAAFNKGEADRAAAQAKTDLPTI